MAERAKNNGLGVQRTLDLRNNLWNCSSELYSTGAKKDEMVANILSALGHIICDLQDETTDPRAAERVANLLARIRADIDRNMRGYFGT